MTNSTTVDHGCAMPNNNSIANIITDFGMSEAVTDTTIVAYMELFVSDDFSEFDIETKRAYTFEFRLLLDVLFEISRVERLQYGEKT